MSDDAGKYIHIIAYLFLATCWIICESERKNQIEYKKHYRPQGGFAVRIISNITVINSIYIFSDLM